jgi:two-component system phosphate regulon sensor histidine kinase PhoR
MFRSIRWRIATIFTIIVLACIIGLSIYLDRHFDISNIDVIIILASLAAAVITIAAAFLASRVTTVPLKKLTNVFEDISEGQFGQQIEVTSKDEVGELTSAFNLMSTKINEVVSLLTTERDLMQVILSNMGDSIFVVDADSTVVIFNTAAEKLLGLPSKKVEGWKFSQRVHNNELNDILQRCLKTKQQQAGTVVINPQKTFLGVIATPLKDRGGCLLLLQDLTQMQRLQAMRRDFVSNVSHELRTPIASIKALAETLMGGTVNDAKIANDFLSKLNTEVDKVTQIVQELSELSRIESGETTLEKTAFDMNKVIDATLQRLKTQADRAEVSITATANSGLQQASGDSDKIEQVLINLIHNSIKFTAPNGSINVTAQTSGKYIEVTVTDTGRGIPSDDLPRIFERFYKVDRARSSGGTGLGLAVAKHLVEAHGGNMWAESIEGQGSTFHFTIPQN